MTFSKLYECEKKLFKIWDKDKKNKSLHLEFVSDFSIFLPKI